MNNRLPFCLVAIGLIGLLVFQRLAAHGVLPPAMRTDFVLGLSTGIFLGIETLGVLLMRKRRCGSAG